MIPKRDFMSFSERPTLLGFGCMRLPLNTDGTIDKELAQEMGDRAIAGGVNYFDTAWPYHGGKSELFIGEALKKYPRESFYLADKMPARQPSAEAADQLFEEQLKKCQVEYFDFYLAHGLNANNFKVFEAAGCFDVLMQKKKEGKIKHLGFSYHDNLEALQTFLDAHPWEFVQMQLNYVDWQSSDAKSQYELIVSRGLPVLVMEPVRGGALANLKDDALALLKEMDETASAASWAIRYAASMPGVMTVLSGMTTPDQIADNLNTMQNFCALHEAEMQTLEKVAQIFRASGAIPCTGCRYCMDCPAGVDIPRVFAAYNMYRNTMQDNSFKNIYRTLLPSQRAEHCVGCGACVIQCPQGIDIPAQMQLIAEYAAKVM